MAKKLDNIEGVKFNKLTVISESSEEETRYPSGARKRYYKCLCECGNYTFVCRQALLSGHTKSCGCAKSESRIEDLSGKKFARLSVIALDEESNKLGLKRLRNGEIKSFATKWICECECGNKTSVGSYQLKSGRTKSCGCYKSEITSERNKETSTKVHQFDIGEHYSIVYSENKKDFFIVDNEDLEHILCWFWRKDKKGYWVTNAKKKIVLASQY